MTVSPRYLFLFHRLRIFIACPVVSVTSRIGTLLIILNFIALHSSATTYTVSDKTNLQNKMNAALPGDTVIVANGTYNWGQIVFTNNNGTSSSAWIVLKAQTFRGVVFNGSTYLQFKGTHVMIDGFRFADGNAGTNAVVSFRSSSSSLANYCRITNIIIDNYNTYSSDSSVENEWVGIYGTNNRVDHCTFINKYNARATVVVWYSSTSYPNPAVSTYHRIDSNYFRGRSYLGANGGESMRIGDSNTSRTDGYNTIEYNLFEGLTQVEPEIISNKSDFNIYRYNTFKNSQGGLTLRHGRYCSVYGNFFIVDDASVTQSYGIRAIDRGHKIFNNYIEAVNGNSSGGTSQLRAPINLYNGLSTDTTDAAAASGYFPADSCIVAFNTIVNAKGGGGIVLGGTGGGTFQPKGIVLANNLVKMGTGSAVYLNPSNTLLTYSAEGNLYDAPSGLGISSTGWTNSTLLFGGRVNGILSAPTIVQDAAVNSAGYFSLLQNADVRARTRSSIFDVGAEEINASGSSVTQPLDSNLVGAGKPVNNVFPVRVISFEATLNRTFVDLNWQVADESSLNSYQLQNMYGNNSITIAEVKASAAGTYFYKHVTPKAGRNYYRLKLVNIDGSFAYTPWQEVFFNGKANICVFPNPATKQINVKLSRNFETPTTVVLYNADGKELRKQNVTNNNIITLSVNNLEAGTYFLKVLCNNEMLTYPIIINR
jgi:poly(beta-D-mannuronate) lyase